MRIIGGLFKGQTLKAPKGIATRPTSSQLREAVFNICRHKVEEADVLDLFCGSGAIGIEALSRGAKSAVFVDKDGHALLALQENLQKFHLEERVLRLDALVALKRLAKEACSFDIIYVDPPYEAEPKRAAFKGCQAAKILAYIDESTLLKPDGLLLIEEGGAFERQGALTSLHEESARTFGKSILFRFLR